MASSYTDSESEDDDENYSEGSKVPKVSIKFIDANCVHKINCNTLFCMFFNHFRLLELGFAVYLN